MQFFISEISIKIFRIKIFAVFLERKKNPLEGRTDRQHLRITTRWSFEDWGPRSERSNHERFHSCHPRWRTSGVPFRRFPSREDPWNDGAHSRLRLRGGSFPSRKNLGYPTSRRRVSRASSTDHLTFQFLIDRIASRYVISEKERERESAKLNILLENKVWHF